MEFECEDKELVDQFLTFISYRRFLIREKNCVEKIYISGLSREDRLRIIKKYMEIAMNDLIKMILISEKKYYKKIKKGEKKKKWKKKD